MLLSIGSGFVRSVYQAEAGDEGGEGGGGEGGISEADVQKRIDSATSALKATNAEIKKEKTEQGKKLSSLTAQIDKLGGDEGIESLVKFKTSFESTETGKLLADGKHEEWFEEKHKQRLGSLEKDHANQITEHVTANETLKAENVSLSGRLHSILLDQEVVEATDASKTNPENRKDIRLHVGQVFEFDAESDGLVRRDKEGGIKYGKDGSTPQTVLEWLEDQQETSRHWWPDSKGGGASGGGKGGSGRPTKYSDDPREYRAQREAEEREKRR